MGDFEKARNAPRHKNEKVNSRGTSPSGGRDKRDTRAQSNEKPPVKAMADEECDHDHGAMSDSGASSCGSAQVKAMVSEGQCNRVFGIRRANSDEFKSAKKKCCRARPIANSVPTAETFN